MYQFEEFTKYIYQQVEGDENQEMFEEQREEKNMEDGEDNKNIWKQGNMINKFQLIQDASNRLIPEHKRYNTYSMEYKIQLIQEVK